MNSNSGGRFTIQLSGVGSAAADTGERDAMYDRRPAFDARLAAVWKARAKLAVQKVIFTALSVIGPLSDLHIRPRKPLRPGDPAVRRILIVRADLIGDLVLSLPAVEALHKAYPHAELDVLALPSSAGVLAGERTITRVLTYDQNVWRRPASLVNPRNWAKVRSLITMLRSARYDLCVSISGDWSSVLARVSGARRRVGYAGEAYPGFMTDPVPGGRYAVRKHEIEYVRAIARAAGGIVADDSVPVLHVDPDADAQIGCKLASTGFTDPRKPLVALHPGAHNGMAKRWPAAYWAALADRLHRELGAQVMLIGSSGEMALASTIMRKTHRSVCDLSGQTTLPELVALLARCDLLVSGDSGPLHIASAVGTLVVGLYGPTDPIISGPLGRDAIVVRQDIWCSPCYNASATADCRFNNPVCMKALVPDMVFAAARKQLARWKDAPPEYDATVTLSETAHSSAYAAS